MKRGHRLISFIILLSTLPVVESNAQVVAGEKESARAFVQKFYDWYVVLYNAPVDKKHPAPSGEVALKQHPEYFDANLLNALHADYKAQAKVKGEIVGLDFDPFLSGQDIGSGYQTGKVKQLVNKFAVDIHDVAKSASEKQKLAASVPVIAELIQKGGRWVLTDFVYQIDRKKYRLLTILKDLSNERKIYSK